MNSSRVSVAPADNSKARIAEQVCNVVQGFEAGPCVIVNADDWGRDQATTDRILDCVAAGAISSVSAMVFMQDSERAASIAGEHGVDAGLHLNFTDPFPSPMCPDNLREHQDRVGRYLQSHRFAKILFHPGLVRSFEYVVRAQVEEFTRLYRAEPQRFDGHHHMHLCANVLFGQLLPPGTIVRRNFSFGPGEKSCINRRYRQFVDSRLARRHRLTDFFFSLAPLDPVDRLHRIFALARSSVVELETHPVNWSEYHYLARRRILDKIGSARFAPAFILS